MPARCAASAPAEPAARRSGAGRFPELIATAIADRSAFRVPVVMHSAGGLRSVARDNPLPRAGVNLAKAHVAFLADHPGAVGLAKPAPDRSPPDALTVRGREIYLHCPNGMARSKLTSAYSDARLGTTSTMRTWRTVLRLLGLAGGP